MIASLVMIAAVFSVNKGIDDRVQKIPRVELALASPPPEGANFLLIGSDTRAFVSNPDRGEPFGDAQSEGGQRSDTIMVAHVEPELAADVRRVVPARHDGEHPGPRA